MAIKTFYVLTTTATSPGWFGSLQEDGTAPAAANAAFGVTVGKLAVNSFGRVRAGATAVSTTTSATSFIATATGPQAGTGATATTAGDSFRTPAAYTGNFPAGNWAFTWRFRPTTVSMTGRVRMRVWASVNADGSAARELTSAIQAGAVVAMTSTTTDYNSTITWAAPAITLAGEYLFFQLEWQEQTTAGSVNGATFVFRTGAATVTTTNFAGNHVVATGGLAVGSPSLPAANPVEQVHVVALAPFENGSPSITSGEATQDHAITVAALATGSPALAAGATSQALNFTVTAAPLATGSPVLAVGAVAQGHVVNPNALAVGPPTQLTGLVVQQFHTIVQQPLTVASPTLANGAVTQAHVTTAAPLAVGSPSRVTGAITQLHVIAAAPLALSSPSLASGAAGQLHNITAVTLAVASPSLAGGGVAQASVITAAALSAVSPAVAGGAVTQQHKIGAQAFATGALALPAVSIGAGGDILAAPLATGSPAFVAGAVAQYQSAIAAPLAVASPAWSVGAVAQQVFVNTSLNIGRPTLEVGAVSTLYEIEVQPLAVGPPSLVAPIATQQPLRPPLVVIGSPSCAEVTGRASGIAPVIGSVSCALITLRANKEIGASKMSTVQAIEFHRRESYPITVLARNRDGTPMNLEGGHAEVELLDARGQAILSKTVNTFSPSTPDETAKDRADWLLTPAETDVQFTGQQTFLSWKATVVKADGFTSVQAVGRVKVKL